MTILRSGHLTLSNPNQCYAFSNLDLLNYQLTVNGPTALLGFDLLMGSDLTLTAPDTINDCTTFLENGSQLSIPANLTGTGDIISNDSSILVGGSSVTSETIGLMNNSQLYLGTPPDITFMPTVYIDSTSTIHLDADPNGWAESLTSNYYNEMLNATHPPADLIGGMAYVKSLTPGYQPRAEFQFAPGPGSIVTGVTIVDAPIIAHS